MLILKAVVSYRSIPKILNLFSQESTSNIKWIPHFTSTINWIGRVGVGVLKDVSPMKEDWIAIIDHSINVGTKKLLVVLRVKMDSIYKKGSAIKLEDCECIGLKICEVVNGESTSKDLKEIFDKVGTPKAIIKDTDATLNKGVSLFSKENKDSVLSIDDISHVVANALKKEFENDKDYKTFTKMLKNSSARLRNTAIAFLTPPKQRTKARFQNVSRLGKWGEKMMTVFSKRGRAKKGSILEKLRQVFPQFTKLRPFIERFAQTTAITSKVMETLKNRGLDKLTYQECKLYLQELPKNSITKKRLNAWLDKHIKIQENLNSEIPMIVSSDIIESLFGKFKYMIEKSPQGEMNRAVLIIPSLCGEMDELKITKALETTKQKDLKEWLDENVGKTFKLKRKEFLEDIQKVGNVY